MVFDDHYIAMNSHQWFSIAIRLPLMAIAQATGPPRKAMGPPRSGAGVGFGKYVEGCWGFPYLNICFKLCFWFIPCLLFYSLFSCLLAFHVLMYVLKWF